MSSAILYNVHFYITKVAHVYANLQIKKAEEKDW